MGMASHYSLFEFFHLEFFHLELKSSEIFQLLGRFPKLDLSNINISRISLPIRVISASGTNNIQLKVVSK